MIDQLKALAEAATKGPWKHYGLDGGHLVFEDAAGSSIASSIGRNHVGNAKYIAAANPQRILALIAENERADKLLQQALDALEDESLVKINNSVAAIRTYLEVKK